MRPSHSCTALVACSLALLAGSTRASTEDDSCLEPWKMVNFQTKSPTFNQSVASSDYQGHTTIFLLLASW